MKKLSPQYRKVALRALNWHTKRGSDRTNYWMVDGIITVMIDSYDHKTDKEEFHKDLSILQRIRSRVIFK